jgi:catalase
MELCAKTRKNEGKAMNEPRQPHDLNDLISVRGNGGEIHQHASGETERLTTAQGVTISDNQNSS